jgi:hypothetical protein
MKVVAIVRLKSSGFVAILTAGVCLATNSSGAGTAANYKPNQIRVEYVLPKNPASIHK